MWIKELLQEFLEKPYQNNLLTKSYALYPKLIYLILGVMIWFFSKDLIVYILMIAINILLLAYLRAYRTILTSLSIWLSTFAVIIFIDYIFMTLKKETIINILYSYLTLTISLLYYLSTPAHQLRELFGTNILTLSYTLIRSFIREVLDTLDSMEVRGYETKYNFLRYVGVIYTLFRNSETRALVLEEALKVRGAEE